MPNSARSAENVPLVVQEDRVLGTPLLGKPFASLVWVCKGLMIVKIIGQEIYNLLSTETTMQQHD